MVGAVALSMAFYVIAFPPVDIAEAAYLFAVPALVLFFRRPAWRMTALVAFMGGWIGWTILIFWLRHVTLVGTLALAGILALFLTGWFLAARWAMPRVADRPFLIRMSAILGLAGLWVVLEWTRTWLFTGFPWLPLSASQWTRPAMLQIAPLTGAYGVSFLLIMFNVAVAFYLRNLLRRRKKGAWYTAICPEFYASLLLLIGCSLAFLSFGIGGSEREELFTVGIVQPRVPAMLEWNDEAAARNMQSLERNTAFAAVNGSHLVLWPESATPYPVYGVNSVGTWVEGIAARNEVTILMGNMAWERAGADDAVAFYNIATAAEPEEGLLASYYAKRHLVPFGEYVPLQDLIPFIEQVVPFGSFTPGTSAKVLTIAIPGFEERYRVGPLVCYEDVFPVLSRDLVKNGAQFLFVATNNAWYGEEGGHSQHAAHSVLRAVETRRPVLRCGNDGWSGWIDAFGNRRFVMLDPESGIHIEGTQSFDFSWNATWQGKRTVYVIFGDWFVAVCAVLVGVGYVAVRVRRVPGLGAGYRPGSLLKPGAGDGESVADDEPDAGLADENGAARQPGRKTRLATKRRLGRLRR